MVDAAAAVSARVPLRSRALRALLAKPLEHLLTLLRRGTLPLFAQLLAPRWRQSLEAAEVLAHSLLTFRGQRVKLLPALSQNGALVRRQCAPALKPIPRSVALLRTHGQPPATAIREGLLALRWQTVPLTRKA